jgi:hypothetical protein
LCALKAVHSVALNHWFLCTHESLPTTACFG